MRTKFVKLQPLLVTAQKMVVLFELGNSNVKKRTQVLDNNKQDWTGLK
jgi:hypothetical protein